MGKRETKETLQENKRQATSSEQQLQEAKIGNQQVAGNIGQTVAGEKEGLNASYAGMGTVQNLGYTPVETRSIDVSALKDNLAHVSDFAATGGFTPGREESIMEGVNNLKAMGGADGGLSAETINRIRGNGGFEEFASTGGYTPTSIANIKAQALSPIGSYASGTRDELARRSALTGGYAPGFDAANRQLSRDTARQIADTSLNANVGIQEKVNAGRQWGISGLSGAESALANQQSSNRLNANTSASNIELNLQDTISRYRAMGLSMEQATAKALSDFDAQNVSNEMATSQFNASNKSFADQFNIKNEQEMRQAGIAGLQGIYNTDVNQEQAALDRAQQLQLEQSAAGLGYLQNRTDLATRPGSGTNWGKAIGTGAGIAAMFVSSRDAKEDLQPLSDKDVRDKLKKLPLYNWKYKGDNTRHIGPTAEEFHEAFGVGDGKTIHLADVAGVMLASQKAGIGGVK